MKTYQIILTKSYMITIDAGTKEHARRVTEFYTSDIHDISTEVDRKKFNFSIEKIKCGMNESLNAEEIENA